MSLLADVVAFIQCLFYARAEDEPPAPAEQLDLDAQARTEWVRSHRQQEGSQ